MHIDGLYDNVHTAMLEKRIKALETTHQRQWVELTDAEITSELDQLIYSGPGTLSHKTFARAIEAKLKQKNGY
jgi:hypothetical protein